MSFSGCPPALFTIVGQTAVPFYDAREFKGHGYSGGMRLNTARDVVRVGLWLLWNQVFLRTPDKIAQHWQAGRDDQTTLEWRPRKKAYAPSSVKETIDKARLTLGMRRRRGRHFRWWNDSVIAKREWQHRG